MLLLIIITGFGLRLYHLDQFGFWLDEGLTPLRSGYPLSEILSNHVTIQGEVTNDTVPPFYFLIIHASRQLLGSSDFAFRYPSLLAGILLLPLLYQLGRRLNGPMVGMLAMSFAAINPLQVWYAQEARMYTLVVLLTAAASYALWRGLTTRRTWRWFGIYLLLAFLSFYTHYLAAFLVAFQGLFWLWLLWRRGLKRIILAGLLAAALAAIPIIPITIPRLFTGAETNYQFVPPWTMLWDLAGSFWLGVTASFGPAVGLALGLGLLAVLVTGVVAPGMPHSGKLPSRMAAWFLLAYLLAVLTGIAIISPLKPMYQGVRHTMIGSPAYYLLAARAVLALWRMPLPWRTGAGFAYLFLVVTAGLSLSQLYLNPRYAKDDFRALIWQIDEMAGDNDVVVYNDAILLPLHYHYSRDPGLAATALPTYPLTVEEDNALAKAEALAESHDRLWFVVGPPGDDRDTDGQVQTWLEAELPRLHTVNAHARSRQVLAHAYAGQPAHANILDSDIVWPGLATLASFSRHFDTPAARPALWFDLAWAEDNTPPEGGWLRLRLRDPAGATWTTADAPAWLPSGQPRPQIMLRIPPGLPPGEYDLQIQLWDGRNGAVLGDWQSLTTVSLASTGQWSVSPDWPFAGCGLVFEGGIRLRGVEVVDTVRPGHPLPISIFWQGVSPGDMRYRLSVIDEAGQTLRADEGQPLPGWASDPGPDQIIRQHAGIYFPPDTNPGEFALQWELLDGNETIPGRHCYSPLEADSLQYGHVTVDPWPLETDLPPLDHPLNARFGDAIRLAGADLEPPGAAAMIMGGELAVTLYWQALQTPGENYVVFLHLRDESGEAVAQSDQIPVEWLRPTQSWRPNEVLADRHLLSGLDQLPPGDYQLYAGLYLPEIFTRPPVTLDGAPQADNQVLLATISVP